ncbi:hypothetical protein EJB05_11847, partial [Eragrostis curvula]
MSLCQPPSLPDDRDPGGDPSPAPPTALVHASIACSSFRSLVTNHSFLRWYRSLHPPLLLGFIDGEFQPAKPPSLAYARATNFDFDDYVPCVGWFRWATSDVHNGRVLLRYAPWVKKDSSFSKFPHLAMWDPLFRQYQLLPPIPNAIRASI